MAKATRANGASFTPEELADPTPPPRVERFMIGLDTQERLAEINEEKRRKREEAQSSAGNSSSQSGKSDETDMLNPAEVHQPPAHTTESPSFQEPNPELSDADLTAGSTPETETESDEDEEIPPYTEWTIAELKAELGKRELPLSGKHADLVARLEADDEEASEDDSEDF